MYTSGMSIKNLEGVEVYIFNHIVFLSFKEIASNIIKVLRE